jgi:hypothetical protein
MRQGLLATAFAGLVMAISGCGGDDDSSTTTGSSQPDGAALVEPFNALAAQAYTDAGKDRDEDYTSGTQVDGCPIADDEAAAAIAEAAGLDELTFADEAFVQGLPEQQEIVICSIEAPAGADHPSIVNLTAGTTTYTRDQQLSNQLRLEEGAHELEGEAEGLDPGSVLAVTGEGLSRFGWVDGDFQVSLGGPSDQLSPDQGFAALSAAVSGVSRTLSD